MKSWIMLSLMLASVGAVACDKGCSEYEGVCACDIKPAEVAAAVDTSVWVSDEKPSRHPEPAWQRGEVKVIDVPATGGEDAKQDLERQQADRAGKLAAGIGKVTE